MQLELERHGAILAKIVVQTGIAWRADNLHLPGNLNIIIQSRLLVCVYTHAFPKNGQS